MDKITKWLPIATAVLLFFLVLGTCSATRKQAMILEKMETLQTDTVKAITAEEMRSMLKKSMYESLVLEEDVDKGNISISEIKKHVVEEDLK